MGYLAGFLKHSPFRQARQALISLVISKGAKLYKYSFTCDVDGRYTLVDANGTQCCNEDHKAGDVVSVSGIKTSTGTLTTPNGSKSVSFQSQ